jgi:hypothetical protein
VADPFQEPLKKRVGGSLSKLPPLQRLENLRRNLLAIRNGKWSPPSDDGTHVRKTVGDRLDARALRRLQENPRAFD